MRVVLYIRVSTTEQAEEGYSIRAQRTQLLDYCRVNDYEVVDIYIDDGYSAKDLNRPRLRNLLKDAQKGLFDAVVVYKLDRFTRSVRDLYDLLERLQTHNVGFISKQEKFDTTTAMGRAMIGLLAVFAQFERELIAERVRMGQEQKVREGKKPGGRVPYGYDKDELPIPEEIENIRYLRHLYMKENLGMKSIAMRMNQEGRLRRGYDWRSSTVALTLENPYYAGIIQMGSKMPNGKYPQRKRELRTDVMRSYGSHEPVWTEAEYEEHLRLMRQRSDAGYSRKLDYWYSGILRCGNCGQAMYGRLTTQRSSGGKIVRKPYYICGQRKENSKCNMPMLRQEHVEHLMMEYINKFRIDQSLKSSEKERIKVENKNREKELQKLRREASAIKERVKKWQYMFVEGLLTADVLRIRINEEGEKEAEINAKMEELRSQEIESPQLQLGLFTLADIWPQLTDMEKKEMLAMTFDEIRVFTDEVKPKGVKNRFYDATIKVKYRSE